ncbi:MAG: hypothetical protein DCC49_02755 [Acidobacteria bacterium]|nr:MAG: hypothetical protein DCC49_02755 [Acidobacteriota bacterium]
MTALHCLVAGYSDDTIDRLTTASLPLPMLGRSRGRDSEELMTRAESRIAFFVALALVLGLIAVGPETQFAEALTATDRVPVGTNPYAIAVNPVTNQIYVANRNSANIHRIDGNDGSKSPINTGITPTAIAVNSTTNKVYVANDGSNSVTVYDATGNFTKHIPVGNSPRAVAVDSRENKVYVANSFSSNVTIIDAANGDSTSTMGVGVSPVAIAINTSIVPSRIYVANSGSNTVTVFTSGSPGWATVPVGSSPAAIAINPLTDKIYVANSSSSNVTVINGSNLTFTNVAVGLSPNDVAINQATNKIYVPNASSNSVTVIDGLNNSTSAVATGTQPFRVAINQATNMIYAPNYGSGNVTVINGGNNSTTTSPSSNSPWAVAVNQLTNKVYVTNRGDNNVTVIEDSTIDDLADDIGDPSRRAVCAEGTARPGFQMYITIASDLNQTIRIEYLTNYGKVSKTQSLSAGVRYTEDARGNVLALLAGSGLPYDPNGVDMSIKILGTERVYVACPLYFNSSIGAAGSVNGGHVQDSTRG